MRDLLAVFIYYRSLCSGSTLYTPFFNGKGVTKMLSWRQEIVNHYLQKSGPIKEAAAATAITDRYLFQGDGLYDGVVVRIDLNGYSAWARNRLMIYRVNLLRSCLKTPYGPPQGSSKRSVRRAFFIGRDVLEPRLFSSQKGWKSEFSDGF